MNFFLERMILNKYFGINKLSHGTETYKSLFYDYNNYIK